MQAISLKLHHLKCWTLLTLNPCWKPNQARSF